MEDLERQYLEETLENEELNQQQLRDNEASPALNISTGDGLVQQSPEDAQDPDEESLIAK